MRRRIRELPERIQKWTVTPSVNPRYRGASPMDVARALVGKPPVKAAPLTDEDGEAAVKSAI